MVRGLFSFLLFSGLTVNGSAQELPTYANTINQFSVFNNGVVGENAFPTGFNFNVQKAIGEFETLCSEVFKNRIRENHPEHTSDTDRLFQDKGYERIDNSYFRTSDNISVKARIDENVSVREMRSVDEWYGSHIVKQLKPFDSHKLGWMCSFEINDTDLLSAKHYKQIGSEFRRNVSNLCNVDISKHLIRSYVPNENGDGNTIKLSIEFEENTDVILACKDRFDLIAYTLDGQGNVVRPGFSNGRYSVSSNGNVLNPQGQTIGRVNGDGDIINAAGQIIGRFNQ